MGEGAHRRDELPVRLRRGVMDRFVAGGGVVVERDKLPLGTGTSSSRPSSSTDGAPGESRPYAWSLRNCVQVGPIRRGAGPRPPWRSTVAMVVAEVPDFLELAGSVPVPPEKRGSTWSRTRAETWRKRAADHR